MIIYFKGATYDIPIQNNWDLTRVIDGTLSSGYVKTAPLDNVYGDLDLSRRIPRGLKVKLERDGREFYMMTGEVVANKVTFVNGKYEHMINLISLEKDLQRIPLENMTVTQPKGDLGQYSRSVNKKSLFVNSELTDYTVLFDNTVNSNTTVINGLTVVQLKEFTVSGNIIFDWFANANTYSVKVDIYYGASIINTETFILPYAFNNAQKQYAYDVNLKYNPTAINSFSMKISVDVIEIPDVDPSVIDMDLDITLAISSTEILEKPVRTYAQVIDKILRKTDYVLSSKSRARLNLTCPEYKFEEYTVYDGLSTIAGFVGALVKVGDEINKRLWTTTSSTAYVVEGDSLGDFNPYDWAVGTIVKVGLNYYINSVSEDLVKEINYEFFDRPNVVDLDYNTKHEIAELEDYTSAVELNTKNVVKPLRYSPFKGGFKGVRSTGVGQQTTGNILYELEDIGDRITEVKAKGLASRNAANTVTWSESDVTDITSRVLDKNYYDTLSSEKDVTTSGKGTLRKHNTLFHEQGSKFIDGLTYLGEDLSQVVGNADVIRAVYETILAVRTVEAGELITRTGNQSEDDPGLAGDIKLRFQVTYSNITESRARVYKDDQSGFERETIKYLNESANINESQAIGDYAQLIINRLGGTKTVYRGIARSFDELPEVGDITSDGKVYTMIKTNVGRLINYEITAVQDYNIISSYIGIVSRHRTEEISSSDSVLRTLRWTSRFIFIPTQEAFATRLITSEDILSSLVENSDMGLNYAYLETNLSNGEKKKIHLSLDSDSKGKTIEIKFRLKDNYSAGLKRYLVNIGGNDVYLNKDVEYADLYGKVNDMSLFVYYDTTAFSSADDEAYPEALTNKGNEIFTVITDVIDKDARETIAGLIEIPIFSEDDEIRVYNGFAKYNKLVEGTDRIKTALLLYTPRKNDKLVDTSRIIDTSITGSYAFGRLNFSFTSPVASSGIAWYHEDTLELVMAYVKDLETGIYDVTKYYKVVDSSDGGGLNIAAFIEISHNISHDYVQSNVFSYTFNSDLTHETLIVIGQDEYEGVSMSYLLSHGMSVSTEAYTSNENLTHDTNIVIGQDEYQAIAIVMVVSDEKIATTQAYVVENNILVSVVAQTIYYEWQSGGTSPVGGTTCGVSADVGNIVCDTSCSYVETDVYLTTTDETDINACTIGGTQTICVQDGAFWTCTVYTGTAVYSNCQTCVEVIE